MNATAAAIPVTAGQSWSHAARLVLITLAIVVLLAVSFVLGRATGSTAQHVPAIAPTVGVHTSIDDCRVGRAC
jgi:hypothetical protein